jgi:rhodanese-related sulfurtransferase
MGSATTLAATPVVVGNDACPNYAVDIESFASCEGDRVAMPAALQLTSVMLLAEPAVPLDKRTWSALYVDAPGAYALKRAYPDAVVLVDIRSSVEIGLTGHPHGVDLNVAYRDFVQPLAWDTQANGWKMVPNPRFAADLDAGLRQRGATTDTIVMLLCRSGEGSARAADDLALRGYTRVVSVTDGFEGDVGPDGRRALNGWKNAGLPWTARVDAALIAGVR